MDFVNSFNFLLLCLIVLAAINVVSGYRKGMVKAIVSLVSLVIMCVVVIPRRQPSPRPNWQARPQKSHLRNW